MLPDDLAATLPPVTQGWRDFAARDTFAERFFAPRPDPRETVAGFVDSIGAGGSGDDPALYFLHVLLPHHPWIHLRTGQRFTLQRGDVGLHNERWVDDEWAAAIRYQRHLLQVQYVDTVVGRLTARLRAAGLYDDALIAITADHGASLRAGFPFLQATEASFADVAAVPLFIKQPGQQQGQTVDTSVEIIDVLPTLAAALGVRLPWTTDGSDVLDPAWSGRPAKTLLAGGATRRMAGPADLRGAVMERVAHKLALFDGGNPLNPPAAGGRSDLLGRRAGDYPAAAAANIAVTVDAPELLGAVDPGGDFVPAHISGTATVADGAPPPLLAVTLNGVVAAVTKPYPFRTYGRDGAWETIVDPALLRPGANTLGVFAVEERAGGEVALAEAYAGGGEPRAFNLIRDTAAELLGATNAGFHGLEHADGRAFRWTTGEASVTVPIDVESPPAALAVDVLMTGRPKQLRVEADGCVLFDDAISNRWSERFALDGCRLTPPRLEIRLLSDTHVPDGGDNRTLGVGVAAVELRGG